MAALSEARAAAAAQAEQLCAELAEARDATASQADVIAALMRRSEELCADAGRVRELASENDALRRGLEQQAGTLARLIALNEELADAANVRSAAREAGAAPAEAAGAATPTPLYDEEWELEEAEARARGDPPARGLAVDAHVAGPHLVRVTARPAVRLLGGLSRATLTAAPAAALTGAWLPRRAWPGALTHALACACGPRSRATSVKLGCDDASRSGGAFRRRARAPQRRACSVGGARGRCSDARLRRG